jgi:hypothetical protein
MTTVVSGIQVRCEELDAIITRRLRAGALSTDALAEHVSAVLARSSVYDLANIVKEYGLTDGPADVALLGDLVAAARALPPAEVAARLAARLAQGGVVAVRRVDPKASDPTTPGQTTGAPREAAPDVVIRAITRKIATEDLVGLALSGGGIRSASFNLGLLEALNADATADKNLLRQIDYLSTVSGGGYIGSHLSSQLVQPGSTIDNLPLRAGPGGEPTPHVWRMIHGGKYLNRPLHLVNRYLIGLVYNNIVFIGAALALTLLIALLWRGLDWPPVHSFLTWLSGGAILDYNRPFLPGLVMLLAWFVCWAILYWAWICKDLSLRSRLLLEASIAAAIVGLGLLVREFMWGKFWPFVLTLAVVVVFAALFWLRSWRSFALGCVLLALGGTLLLTLTEPGPALAELVSESLSPSLAVAPWLFACACSHACGLFPRVVVWQRRFLLATVMGLLIGVAIWIGVPNINTVNTLAGQRSVHSFIQGEQTLIAVGLAGAVLIGLLPFLRPSALLRSGERPKTQVHLVVFRIASFALLGGLPLGLIYWFGRHDVSSHAARPDRDVVETDLKDWEVFWPKLLNAEHRADSPQAVFLAHFQKAAREHDEAARDENDNVPDLSDSEVLRRLCHRTNVKNWSQWRAVDKQRRIAIKVLNEAICCPHTTKAMLEAPGGLEHVQSAAADLDDAEKSKLTPLLSKWQVNSAGLTDAENNALRFLLFRVTFAKDTWPRDMVRRVVVIEEDQRVRGRWLFVLALLVPLFALVVNANATSPHWFYRDELARAYIQPLVPTSVAQPPPDPADMPLSWFDIPMDKLETTERGGPYHLLSASITKGFDADATLDSRQFLFSQLYCGSEQTGYESSETYHEGEVDLPSAMAISGAALSPLRIRNPLVALIMTLLNLRLGQWLPCPGHGSKPRMRLLEWLRSGPTMFGLFSDIVWNRKKGECRKFLFLSDGGHDENLGIEQLLWRRCRFIVASDAGQDEEHLFADLAKLYRRARLQGIRMTRLDRHGEPASLEQLMLDRTSGLCRQPFIMIRLEYPDGASGLLLYLKPSLLGSEEIDLKFFKTQNANFPHDPTVHALFDPDHVESYRQLGLMIGRRISEPLAKLVAGAPFQRPKALADLLAQSVAQTDAAPELPEGAARVLAGLTRRPPPGRRRPSGKVRGGYTIGEGQTKLPPPFGAATDAAAPTEPPG